MRIPFVGAEYNDKFARTISSQTCVNWYVEIAGQGSKVPVALMPVPGKEEFCDTGTEKPVVAAVRMDDKAYFVSGGSLFRTDISGTVEDLGEMDIGQGRLSLISSGEQVVATNELGGWIYDDTDDLRKITDADYPNAISACFFDGFLIGVQPDSGRHFSSALKDWEDYDALDYATAEGGPDNLIACMNDHRELWLFGKENTEIWYNSGDSGYPMSRITSGFLEYGCDARHSPAKLDNTVFWLANDLTVRRAVGYVPQRISTHAMEREFATYSQTNDAFGYTYAIEGHTYYILTFPTAGATWVYDAATGGAWHKRKTRGYTRDRANCHVKLGGLNLVGDSQNGKIYKLGESIWTDGGEEIERERTAQVISADGRRLTMSKLEIEFEQGDVDYTPKIMVDWSDDGGKTWSDERIVEIGKLGEYKNRAIIRRMGSFHSRTLRLKVTDPAKWVVLGATAEIR